MICPHCHQNIAWPKVILISRWSSIQCETCHSQWNRSLDWQFYALGVFSTMLGISAVSVVGRYSFLWGAIAFVAALALIAYIDAKTIQLVPAKRQENNVAE